MVKCIYTLYITITHPVTLSLTVTSTVRCITAVCITTITTQTGLSLCNHSLSLAASLSLPLIDYILTPLPGVYLPARHTHSTQSPLPGVADQPRNNVINK